MSREEFILTIPVRVRVTVDKGRDAREDAIGFVKEIVGGGTWGFFASAEIIPITKKTVREAWRKR